jgi:hypothetical protein
MEIRNTPREIWRNDFDTEFLNDFVDQSTEYGTDPRNNIGYNCGVNPPRLLQIYHDRIYGD